MNITIRFNYFLKKYCNLCNKKNNNFVENMAGRVLAIRSFGKLTFIKAIDQTSILQIIAVKSLIGNTIYNYIKCLKVGSNF